MQDFTKEDLIKAIKKAEKIMNPYYYVLNPLDYITVSESIPSRFEEYIFPDSSIARGKMLVIDRKEVDI